MEKYKCAFCGKEFDIIDERMDCERVCRKTKAEQERKECEEKLKAERQSRFSEIQKALNTTYKLIEEYCNDYKEGLGFTRDMIVPTRFVKLNGSWEQLFNNTFRL